MCFVADTVILFQRSGVVGEMETVEQVLVNGAPLSGSGKYVSGILRAVLMGNYESFQQAFEIEENVTNTMTSRPNACLNLLQHTNKYTNTQLPP